MYGHFYVLAFSVLTLLLFCILWLTVTNAYRLPIKRPTTMWLQKWGIYVTRHIQFVKSTDSVPQTFSHWGTTEANTFKDSTAVFRLYEQFVPKRQRLHDSCHIYSVRSRFTRGIVCTHAIFLRPLAPRERLSDTWPPILTYVKSTWIWSTELSKRCTMRQ